MSPDSSRTARDLLARLVSRESLLGDAAVVVRERYEEVSRLASRRDHVLAVLGDGATRAALFNQLLGERLLAEDRLDLTGTVVSFARGASDDYRVRLSGGAVEQYSHLPQPGEVVEPAALRLAEVEERLPAAREAVRLADLTIQHELEELNARLAVAEAELAHARANTEARRDAVAQAGQLLPVFHRAPPPWWAFWLWLPRLLLPFWRAARATYVQASKQLTAGEGRLAALARAVEDARAAIDSRRSSVGAPARATLGSLELERERALADLARVGERRRQRFVEALGALLDMGARGPDVEDLAVFVAGDAIPAGLVLLDVSLRGHAEDRERAVRHLLDEADGWLASAPPPPELTAQLAARRVAALPPGQSLTHMLATLRAERVRRITARTGDAVQAARRELAATEERAHRDWRERLAAAQALRVPDPAALAAQQLARSTGGITERSHLAIEHATRELGHELSLVEQRWRSQIRDARTVDDLRAIAQRINAEAPEILREVQHNVRLALGGVVGGAVRDLGPESLASLAPRFQALGSRPPVVDGADATSLEVLAYLTQSGGPILDSSWFASLFRGFEQRRDDAVAKLGERIGRIRNTCTAELLDAEPPITALLRTSIEKLCTQATARLAAEAEARLAEEEARIARERTELAPISALRVELEGGSGGRGAVA
jgi:hypothetical protein